MTTMQVDDKRELLEVGTWSTWSVIRQPSGAAVH